MAVVHYNESYMNKQTWSEICALKCNNKFKD